MINNRFKMKTTPQEDAFGRLGEEGMLSALLEVQGVNSNADDDWPRNLSDEVLEKTYEDYLSAVCWLEYIINPDCVGSSFPRSKYLGDRIQYFEFGLLPYASQIDFRFQFLHSWLVNLMGIFGIPSIKGCAADDVI